MKTTTIKDMIFDAAVLAAVGAIALYAKQASAFGMMGAGAAVGISARAGGIGAGRPESMGSHGGAANVPGAITMNGITVLPNGTVIVPAVTARAVHPTSPDVVSVPHPCLPVQDRCLSLRLQATACDTPPSCCENRW